jgi:hypothetical protein
MLALGFSVLTVGFNESAAFSVVTVGLHHSASFLGVLTTVQGMGAVLGGMVVAGLFGPWLSVAGVTAFQRRTPMAMMGSVFGVLRLALTIPQAASIGIGAALITVVNYRVLLVVIAVVAAASALFVIGQPGVRRRTVPGTVSPDAVASGSAAADVSAAE